MLESYTLIKVPLIANKWRLTESRGERRVATEATNTATVDESVGMLLTTSSSFSYHGTSAVEESQHLLQTEEKVHKSTHTHAYEAP